MDVGYLMGLLLFLESRRRLCSCTSTTVSMREEGRRGGLHSMNRTYQHLFGRKTIYSSCSSVEYCVLSNHYHILTLESEPDEENCFGEVNCAREARLTIGIYCNAAAIRAKPVPPSHTAKTLLAPAAITPTATSISIPPPDHLRTLRRDPLCTS